MSAIGIPYLSAPARIVNEAIDMLGVPGKIIGDVTDGTDISEVARRNYGQALRQLLRTAHWDFARKRAKLTMLGDATGQTPNVSTYVERPWIYAYAWPNDGVMGRWLPWNPPNGQPLSNTGVPLTTANTPIVQYGFQPGRFLVASSDQYPVQTGVVPWTDLPDLQRTEGLGPSSRKIILTDCCDADFVYTRFVPVIEEWDSLFRQAVVTMMALIVAPVAIEDAKLRLATIGRLTPVLKNTIADARVANGNESGYPQTTDFEASWIRARSTLGWGGYGGFGQFGGGGAVMNGIGYFGVGWSSMSWGGSVF